MADALPLSKTPRFGATANVLDAAGARRAIDLLARLGYRVVWLGDHVAFTGPLQDPLIQMAYFGALNPELCFGTSVYLLPLRHPTPVAKMVATLDRMLGANRFIFGVGVGGEFAREYEACGVPLKQRGGRASEAIALIKRLWSEDRVAHRGKYFSFDEIAMDPKPATPGGPPIWVGGRAEAALKRAARLGDGWMPYVVTPKRVGEGLDFIAREMAAAGRKPPERFGTGILLFCTIGETHEAALDVAAAHLSRRYAMDFREPARRYCALGRPADVAARIKEFIAAGVREFCMDMMGPAQERDHQLERFAREVIPLLGS